MSNLYNQNKRSPVSWLLFIVLGTPPGLLNMIFSQAGAGIFIQVALLWILLLAHYFLIGNAFKLPWPPVLALLTLMLAYVLMPRYFDAFGSGGKSRETIGILAYITSIYILIFQVVGGAANRFQTVGLLESGVVWAASGTGVLLLMQYAGLLGGHEGAFSYAGFGHRIHSGIFCALGLFVVVKRLISMSGPSIMRAIYAACMLLLLVVAVMAASRSVMVVVVFAFYFAALARSGVRSMLKISVFVAAFVISIMAYGPAAEKFLQSDFSSGRLDLWEQLTPETLGEAIYGRGVGYMWSLTQFDISQYGGYVSEENESIYAHNDYLFFLVELGAVGVILWLIFLLYHLKHAMLPGARNGAQEYLRSSRASLGFVVVAVLVVESADTVIFGGRNISYVASMLAIYSCQLKAFALQHLPVHQSS